MQVISASEFIFLSSQYPVIDVRSPTEYEHGHIPGAINIPLFNNEERAIVGIEYKERGRKAAMLKGMELVSPKFTTFIKQAEDVAKDGTLLVHCWRGGMRSAGLAWLWEWYGFKVYTLEKGYKAFRRWVIDTFAMPFHLKIIGGRTGSGKTHILYDLEKKGQPIIDLERIANHKGSAFGTLGEDAQPTEEMFENMLAMQLYKIFSAYPNSTFPIWVEDESQNIGKRIIPDAFFRQMRSAEVYYVDISFEQRVENLIKEYGNFSKDELIACIDKIIKRLGPQHAKAAKIAISEGDIKRACEICLKYYDKSYDHGINKRNPATIHSFQGF
jgi:tRNA 2-selenouridine synthase